VIQFSAPLSAFCQRCSNALLLPNRHTIGRWWRRLHAQYAEHGLHLRNRFPNLGRHESLADCWSACLEQMSPATAMALLDRSRRECSQSRFLMAGMRHTQEVRWISVVFSKRPCIL
jgi:hypothetical protein